MSDQDRDKLGKTDDEDATDEVEAHKHGHREADGAADESDEVEAHKLGGKDS